MPYTPPNTFADGAALSGPDLAENQIALRDYINGGITSPDIADSVFDCDDIKPPRQLPLFGEMEFATGAFLRRSHTSTVASQRSYFDGRIKNADITQQEVFQGLPSCSRTFFMPTSGSVAIDFTGHAVGFEPGDYAYVNKIAPLPRLVESRVYLVINGVLRPETVCYVFPRQNRGVGPSTQSVAVGTTAFGGSVNADRPVSLHFVLTGLSAGEHTVEIVVDTRHETLFIDAQSFQIEVLLDGGPSNYVGSDFLTGS